MYNQIWKKYLPFIRIQLKKSAQGDQVLELNKIDFERSGNMRKSGYKFNIIFNNGRVGNIISSSPLAVNLAAVMQEDEATKAILKDDNFEITLTTKYQLVTKNLTQAEESNGEDNGKDEDIDEIRKQAEVVGTE